MSYSRSEAEISLISLLSIRDFPFIKSFHLHSPVDIDLIHYSIYSLLTHPILVHLLLLLWIHVLYSENREEV